MALIHLNFQSKYQAGNTDVTVILPDMPYGAHPREFYGKNTKYPVLWLLHGTTGDHTVWLRKSNIERYALEKGLIVVMPSAQNTNYADWPNYANGQHTYRYLTEELMPLIYGWLPASTAREDNFIAGNSMGGRGACIYAYNHPEKFAAAFILSASPQDMRTHLDDPFFALRNRNMVNAAGGMEAFLESPQNIWDQTKTLVDSGVSLPKLYFVCGTEDRLAYGDFCLFREYARQVGLQASFREVPGMGHEWDLWDPCIREALELVLPAREKGGAVL